MIDFSGIDEVFALPPAEINAIELTAVEYEPGDGQGFALSTCLFDPIVGPARRISAIPHLRWTRVAQYGKWRGTLAIDDDYIDYPMPGG
jgi:hypothetical protein